MSHRESKAIQTPFTSIHTIIWELPNLGIFCSEDIHQGPEIKAPVCSSSCRPVCGTSPEGLPRTRLLS